MESITSVISLISKDMYLTSIDIKDAFYSVPIFPDHRKYLKFLHKGMPYQFDVLPNGYVDAMRVFTKLLKPVFSHLREQGWLSVIYVDDSLLLGHDYDECLANVQATADLLESLGFHIHPDKSILNPSQNIQFLGFDIDTVSMTISLTQEKKNGIRIKAAQLLSYTTSIRNVASFIGKLTAAFEAIPLGRLHHRNLEWAKIKALNHYKWNFDKQCTLSSRAKEDIIWWLSNVDNVSRSLIEHPIDSVIYTDSSMLGWGAHMGDTAINYHYDG